MDKNYRMSQSSQSLFETPFGMTEDNLILFGPKCLIGKDRFSYLNPFSAFLMTAIPLAALKTRDVRLLPFLLPTAYSNLSLKYLFLQIVMMKD